MKNIARGHHWISQTYLSRFTADGTKASQLHVVDLNNRKWFDTAPANVAKQRDFNRIESDTLPEDALETSLSKFEDMVARALTNILAAPRKIEWMDWNTVLNFMAMVAVRNPAIRSYATQRAGEQWVKVLWEATDTPEKYADVIAKAKAAGHVAPDAVTDFDTHKSFLERREFTVEFPDGSFAPNEFDQLDEVLKQLGRMRWRLLEAPVDCPGFVTTDRPVTLFRRDGRHPSPEHPVNFGHTDSLVLFPLSPCFVALGDPASGNGTVPLSPIDRALVGRFNFTMIRVCHGMVFAPNALFEVRPTNNGPFEVGNDILKMFGEWVDTSNG